MRLSSRVVGAAALGAAFLATAGISAQAEDKFKVFLSMSYIGNDWQAEAANMVKAMADYKTLRDKVDLTVQVAGRTRSGRSSRSTRWSSRARKRSWSIRSRRPR